MKPDPIFTYPDSASRISSTLDFKIEFYGDPENFTWMTAILTRNDGFVGKSRAPLEVILAINYFLQGKEPDFSADVDTSIANWIESSGLGAWERIRVPDNYRITLK